MPEIRLRPKGQITIPASILEKAQLTEDAMLEVELVNGVITLTPQPRGKGQAREDIMAYAGIFRGAWGNQAQAVDDTIARLRDEWER
jgi:bifunctional DNA-binding transcriptional regulator/antitoxin component of YhaV-PrlF toxin-antitoxin module